MCASLSPPAPSHTLSSIVHVNAVLELRPLVARPRSAPRRQQGSVGVELENRRRRFPDRSRFVRLQRRRAMNDPDVIAPSTATPATAPRIQRFGSGLGQNGSTRNVGTWRDIGVGFCARGRAANASTAPASNRTVGRRECEYMPPLEDAHSLPFSVSCLTIWADIASRRFGRELRRQ